MRRRAVFSTSLAEQARECVDVHVAGVAEELLGDRLIMTRLLLRDLAHERLEHDDIAGLTPSSLARKSVMTRPSVGQDDIAQLEVHEVLQLRVAAGADDDEFLLAPAGLHLEGILEHGLRAADAGELGEFVERVAAFQGRSSRGRLRAARGGTGSRGHSSSASSMKKRGGGARWRPRRQRR
jgi:hypothetical protein